MFIVKINSRNYFLLLLSVFCYVTALPNSLRRTGRECTKDSDCITNAYCHEGKLCLCKERFIAIALSKTNFICSNEATYLGEICSHDIQCTSAFGLHAECRIKTGLPETNSGTCECKSGAHFQDGICYTNSRIGESCKVTDNCIIISSNIRAYCDQSRCVCPPYYHSNNNGTDCLPSSDLDGPCLTDEDCIVMNSRCLNTCVCKMGYVMNEKKTHCLVAAEKLHAPCDEDKQCTEFLQRTICDPVTRYCNCTLDSHEVSGACFKTSRVHEPCSKNEECYIKSRVQSRVNCKQGFCICADGFDMINRTDCVEIRKTNFSGSSESLVQHKSKIVFFFAILATIFLIK